MEDFNEKTASEKVVSVMYLSLGEAAGTEFKKNTSIQPFADLKKDDVMKNEQCAFLEGNKENVEGTRIILSKATTR